MPSDSTKSLLNQIDFALKAYEELKQVAPHDDLSGSEAGDIDRVTSLVRTAIDRITGRNSEYMRQIDEIRQERAWTGRRLQGMVGVLKALRDNIESGHLATLAELLHGEVFADLLEMSEHLVEQGYKDAAAVTAGATLEAHLRRLAEASSVPVYTNQQGPKKADRLNADLARSEVYSKLDQKNVTAWLDLRNKAAHGHFGDYDTPQVRLLIAGLRDFFTRNPA